MKALWEERKKEVEEEKEEEEVKVALHKPQKSPFLLGGSLHELNQILVESVAIGLAEAIHIISHRASVVLDHEGVAHAIVVGM